MTEIGPVARLRFNQIRVVSKTLETLSSHQGIGKVLGSLGRNPLVGHTLVGFRRSFMSFEEAQRCASRYHVPSHEHPGNITNHLSLAESPRTSDYPVLFHLQHLLHEIRSVLDIGGSAGNLFYCYGRYLPYPDDLSWTVFEVPQNVSRGRQLAQQRGERKLHFIDHLSGLSNADTVIISGSLHYFDALPPDLMRYLKRPPKHVFINRTPVIDGPSKVTIQDAGAYYAMSPARILSRKTLLESMAGANYELVDEWKIPDLRLKIPLDPGSSASTYSGFYFRSLPA
jgi:putative methyltransferase (TIGR04325 family)